jgi:hypothetical protein
MDEGRGREALEGMNPPGLSALLHDHPGCLEDPGRGRDPVARLRPGQGVGDLTGATASYVAVGDDVRHIVVPLVLAALVVASWALRPPGRKLERA